MTYRAKVTEYADLGSAKALANPLRQRILRQLALDGEATATTLARKLGVTTGGTSYNLRVLAEHGFVEELTGRPGRERWWRTARRNLRFPVHSEQDPAMRSALTELDELWRSGDQEALGRFLAARDELGEWGDALPYSRGRIRVTLPELAEFFEEYLRLIERYSRHEDSEDADERREVLTRFIAFPSM
ncbi:helix-turn-helix domain-containing protein [Nonomuraea sp. NPDC050310]|uniref:ArsR/SmtB family transcription factor n=1 Tax=unclassified Nonomuraea TaxID=2593643 RepID=UPI00341008AB